MVFFDIEKQEDAIDPDVAADEIANKVIVHHQFHFHPIDWLMNQADHLDQFSFHLFFFPAFK